MAGSSSGSGGVEDSHRPRGVSYSVRLDGRPWHSSAHARARTPSEPSLSPSRRRRSASRSSCRRSTRPRTWPSSSRGRSPCSTGSAAATRSSSSTTAAPTAPASHGRAPQRPDVRYDPAAAQRRQVGRAAARASTHVRASSIVLMDADGQDDPEELPRLLAHLEAEASTSSPAAGPSATTASSSAPPRSSTTAPPPRSPACPARTSTAASRRCAASSPTRSSCTASCTGTSRCSPCGTASASASSTSSTTSAATARSKFGRARFWRGFLDLSRSSSSPPTRPARSTSSAASGSLIGLVGGALLAWMGVAAAPRATIGTRPALQLGVLLVVVAVQMVSLGLLGELMVNLRRDRNLELFGPSTGR